jgi:hypothetical protein
VALNGGVLGHQGGWDEIAFVFVPVCVFAGLLWVANRRASAMEAQREAESPEDEPSEGESPDLLPDPVED